jgi:hypothetical protein
VKFHAQKQNGKSHLFDIFTSKDMENMSLCISQYLTLKITVYAQREPAFSIGQSLIFHVKSMFGKYKRGVAALSTTYRGLTSAGKP